jgi:hypothetical protein
MAVQVIAFPVAARQNTNDDSTAYGKWFLVPFWPETLNLRGLIERVAFDQSVYSRDIVEGVIQKLTTSHRSLNRKTAHRYTPARKLLAGLFLQIATLQHCNIATKAICR